MEPDIFDIANLWGIHAAKILALGGLLGTVGNVGEGLVRWVLGGERT